MKRTRRLLLDDDDDDENRTALKAPIMDTVTTKTVALGLYQPDTVTSRAYALQFKTIKRFLYELKLREGVEETNDIDLKSMEEN